MPRGKRKGTALATGNRAETYRHLEATSPLRPDAGTQSQFKKKKPPKTYRYDSSLSPALEWDGQNQAREHGEVLIRKIREAATVEEARAAAAELAGLSKPFLNWAGKAERLSFDVPTLPLFVHERLSTKAIIETVEGHKRDKQIDMFNLFGDPRHSVVDQVLRAYEYRDKWVNRIILGDSLVVMNSLLHYEGVCGQVQMIYMDPPYGVEFGSNFQPFVRKREVKHNDDEDMTREPEMVKAYRDTWELGLHSYLTYLRDRLLLSRDLLSPSGSVFVQISDENLHHVREVMDEVFGAENFCGPIVFRKTGTHSSDLLGSVSDFILWYAKDKQRVKFHRVFQVQTIPPSDEPNYVWLETPDGSTRRMTPEERRRETALPEGAKIFRHGPIVSPGPASEAQPFRFEGNVYHPPVGRHWSTSMDGMKVLAEVGRVIKSGNGLAFKLYWTDVPTRLDNIWEDTQSGGFLGQKLYVVQTTPKVIERCLLMTTDPGDLVLDPTCGGGTTAYVSEQWGRRWITIDTSRVPLALTRQRLLTATYPYYQLKDDKRGPAGGFVYTRKQNRKGEEVGGIVPHVMVGNIAHNEPPQEVVLVDKPEVESKVTRVSGPFCFEATIPTPVDWEGDGAEDSGAGAEESHGSFVDRMMEVLRKSPVLQVGGGKTIAFKNVRPPAKTLSLSAEAFVANGTDKAIALVFGPENGAVSEKLVYEAAREAHAKSYSHLYVIGFAVQPNARRLIDECEAAIGVPATYVQATPDIMMGDLLKNMRSSQIFSVCGLPEVKIHKVKPERKGEQERYQVEILGLDVFDPVTIKTDHRDGDDVPAWFLDADYNGLCFNVRQAFFPRTGAWESLKKALKVTYEESLWDHLAGTKSAPFEAGEHGQVAVKVIDDRGNELVVVKSLREAKR